MFVSIRCEYHIEIEGGSFPQEYSRGVFHLKLISSGSTLVAFVWYTLHMLALIPLFFSLTCFLSFIIPLSSLDSSPSLGSLDGLSSEGFLFIFRRQDKEVWRLLNDRLGTMDFSPTKVKELLVPYSSSDLGKSMITYINYFYYFQNVCVIRIIWF